MNPEPEKLRECPFCGGAVMILTCDAEGNARPDCYADAPWSGLGYKIRHYEEENKECPIATHAEDESGVGIFIYDTKEALREAWNTRAEPLPAKAESGEVSPEQTVSAHDEMYWEDAIMRRQDIAIANAALLKIAIHARKIGNEEHNEYMEILAGRISKVLAQSAQTATPSEKEKP